MTPIVRPEAVRFGLDGIVVGKTVIYGLARLVQQGATFVMVVMASRQLSTADVGALGLVLSIGAVASTIVSTALGAGMIKQATDYADDVDADRYICTLVMSGAVLSVALGALGVVSARPLALYWLGSEQYVTFARTASAVISLQAFLALTQTALRFKARDTLLCATMVVQGVVTIVATAVLLHAGFGSVAAVLALAGSLAISAAAHLYALPRAHGSAFWLAALKRALVFGLPLIPYVLFAWILNMGDRILVTAAIDVTAAGIYTVAYTLGLAVELLVSSFNMVWAPVFFRQRTRVDFAQTAHRILTPYFVVVAFTVVAVGVFAPVAARWVAPLEWPRVSAIVPWIAVAYGLNAFQYVWINVLYAHDRPFAVTGSMAIAVSTFLLLTWLLLAPLRELAPAVATTMAFAVLAAMTYFRARRLEQVAFDRVVVAGVAMLAVVCLMAFNVYTERTDVLRHPWPSVAALIAFSLCAAVLTGARRRWAVALPPRQVPG